MGFLFLFLLIFAKFYIFWSMRNQRAWGNWFLPYYITGWAFMLLLIFNGSVDFGWSQWLDNVVIVSTVAFIISDLALMLWLLAHDSIAGIRKWSKRAEYRVDEDRRSFIKNFGVFMAGLPFISFIHGFFRGRYNYKIKKVKIKSRYLPRNFDGFRLVQFSDFHAGSFDNQKRVEQGLDKILSLDPDLLVFTGDMVNHSYKELDPYHEMLTKLEAKHGKYAVLGNHDYYGENGQEDVAALVKRQKEMGFKTLMNEHTFIEKSGDRICLVGVENWGKGPFPKRGRLNKAVQGIDDKEFKVLLSHDPSHWEMEVRQHPLRFDLTMSGHTHGMQVGFNLPFLKWSPIKYVYKYWLGLYEEGNERLYVNRGFGWLFFAGRIGMWPEITEFEFMASEE